MKYAHYLENNLHIIQLRNPYALPAVCSIDCDDGNLIAGFF
jgi:hypothetical protein